jgi:hypothetical protein
VDWLAQSRNFGNVLESNQTLLPKADLFLMTCSTSVQIYKIYCCLEVFVLRFQIDLYNSNSREQFLQFSLTISPLWNFISYLILRVGVCMSFKSYYNLWRPPWSTLCPKWSSGAFGIRVTTNLSDHHLVKPAGHRIFWLIQHLWRFGRSCQHEKCFNLDFLPPCKFLDFWSIPN